MSRRLPGQVYLNRVSYDGTIKSTPVTNVATTRFSTPWIREVHTLTALVATGTGSNGFGSVKVCDLPSSSMLVLTASLNLTGLMAGFTVNVGTTLNSALGTVATASTSFATAGSKNMIPSTAGTGAGTTSTIKGNSTNTEKFLFIAAGANALFYNFAGAFSAGATVTLTGTIIVVYADMETVT